MRKKKLMSGILAVLAVFSIISISRVVKNYADKPTKMIYFLKDNESRQEVAARFNVKPEDMKTDGRYFMFYVK